MTSGPLPDFIIIGPTKCATTWMYRCLESHPDVFMPDTDAVHYYDIHYSKGEEWYRGFFDDYAGEAVVGEETPTYIRDNAAPERIASDVPDVKLIVSVRNPFDRAFSHYWHEKSKSKINFEFEEVFENYDLFQNWVVSGFYHQNVQRFLECFPEEQVKIVFFEDLVEDDEAFIRDIYSYLGVDPDFTPEFLNERVNTSRSRFGWDLLNRTYYGAFDVIQRTAPQSVKDLLQPVHQSIVNDSIFSGQSEYEKGMARETRRELEEMVVDDAMAFSDLVGRDLDHWFEQIEPK